MLKETISDRENFDGHVILIVCKTMAKAARVRHSKTKLHIICDIKKLFQLVRNTTIKTDVNRL